MSTWTKDKPTPGKWWVSLAPDKRDTEHCKHIFMWHSKRDVVKCRVFEYNNHSRPLLFVDGFPGGNVLRLDHDILEGAMWMSSQDPTDPFAAQGPVHSQDNDLP